LELAIARGRGITVGRNQIDGIRVEGRLYPRRWRQKIVVSAWLGMMGVRRDVCNRRRTMVHFKPCLSVAISVCALFATVAAGAQATGTTRSAKDGVFTATQATRGGALYEQKCTTCHAARMWGQDWPEKSLFDVYDIIRNYMPEDAPGSLTPQQTRDIVAYILKTNKLPAGKMELSAVDDDLKKIRLALP
jgi:S-disulfanyl-L-cysteine oxidoreductase SoxD